MPGTWKGQGHNSSKVHHAHDTSPRSPGLPATSAVIQASEGEPR